MSYEIKQGDCLTIGYGVPKQSVDLIAVDLPYGITQNKWDSIIPIKPLWDMFLYVLKPHGAMVLTATMPLAVSLLADPDVQDMFCYDLIWEKTISSGQLNVNHMPLRAHEYVLVFANGTYTYNESLLLGSPYTIKRKVTLNDNYGMQKEHTAINLGTRRARSVIKISNPRVKNGHPNQKPVELMEYIVRTYSNYNDTVFDCCMGSGTTGIACMNLGRNFIGIEQDSKYFDVASARLEANEDKKAANHQIPKENETGA